MRINNTLSNFASTLKILVSFLESEGETATNWLLNDSMIVNLHRFQGILLDEGESDIANIEVETGHERIKSTLSVILI